TGQRAGAPVRGVGRLGLQGARDRGLDLGVGEGARGTGPGLVGQPVQPRGGEAVAPLADGGQGDVQVGGDDTVGAAGGGGQGDVGAQGQALGGSRASGPVGEFHALVVGQGNRGGVGAAVHGGVLRGGTRQAYSQPPKPETNF